VAVVSTLRGAQGMSRLTLAEMQQQGLVEYVSFPEALKGKYQSFTQADISALRKAGYKKAFLTVEEGVGRYVTRLLQK
jgi:ADP-L-glycero-D-manno-heptose 6-epimerase